jgi:4-hydroxyphenylpyruvate dioxygenase-like putative hemolysin
MKFHHVGVVVSSIEQYGCQLQRTFAVLPQGEVEFDPIQKVNVQFFAGAPDQVSLELIEPAAEDSPVTALLQKGGGVAHLCFEVEDICAAVRRASDNGAIVVGGPVAAAAFAHRQIAFVYCQGLGLVEFVEQSK